MAKAKPRCELELDGSASGVLVRGATPGALLPAAEAAAPISAGPPARVPNEDEPGNLPLLSPAEPLPRLVSSGTYDVVLELGGGAMATVFMAVKSGSSGFRKVVALKRIHSRLAGNATFVEMLADEARLASRINHPNVCQVLDFGCDDSGYYIALEFLSGQTLQSVFDRVAADPALPAHPRHQRIMSRIVASLAGGLHAAHGLKGDDGVPLEVVHRDITPHNLFLLHHGVAKVTDFGVARARPRSHPTSGSNLKGKVAYMSPEQISGAPIDQRADVFSLGVVFWELLTGQRLFDCRSESETLAAVCSGKVLAPSRLQHAISPKLDRIVLRALASNESDRYQTARDFAAALEGFLLQAGDTVPQVDVVEWLEDLFPGAAEHAEAVQRRALDAPNALNADDTTSAPMFSTPRLRASLAPPRPSSLRDLNSDPLRAYTARTPGEPRAVLRPTVKALARALEPPKAFLGSSARRVALSALGVTLTLCGLGFTFEIFVATGSVSVSTSGSAADVLVAGSRVGHTPVILTLPLGHCRLTLVPEDGTASRDVEVDIGPGGTVAIQIAFPAARPETGAEPSNASPIPAVDVPSVEPPL